MANTYQPYDQQYRRVDLHLTEQWAPPSALPIVPMATDAPSRPGRGRGAARLSNQEPNAIHHLTREQTLLVAIMLPWQLQSLRRRLTVQLSTSMQPLQSGTRSRSKAGGGCNHHPKPSFPALSR